MKKILATFTLIASTSTVAHELNTELCDVDLAGGVYISQERIEFTQQERTLYSIEGHDTLVVHHQEVNLAKAQRALVADYARRIRALVPELRKVAGEGLSLTAKGIDVAFNDC